MLASSDVGAVDAEQRVERPALGARHSHLSCTYGRGSARVEAVRQASLAIGAGEVVALVGESGSGKSTIGRAIVGLVPIEGGEIQLAGVPLDPTGRRTPEQARAIQIIFQNPDSSLNPRHTVGALIARSLEFFRPDVHDGIVPRASPRRLPRSGSTRK